MLHTPASSIDLSSQFADTDCHQQYIHDLSGHSAIPQLDHIAGQYDGLATDFITQPATTYDSSLAEDTEMVVSGADVGLSDFGFPSLDVHMAEDGDLLSTLSTDIAHLMY